MEALEAEEEARIALEEGRDPSEPTKPKDTDKQYEAATKLEGYLDGELEDLFDSGGHMQG